MLLPDGLSTNAYRVLRLSANASSSEVHKAAERARRASALGMAPSNDVDINLLGVLPQTDADIRASVSRLGNPAHRLKERLFWFHQVPEAELTDPSAPGSEFAAGDLAEIIRRHDEALRGLFNAFHANLDDAGAAAWVRALRRWHTIVSDDSYWALSVAIENRGGFEPRALPAEVQSVRSGALSFAAHGLLVEGRDALNRNDTTTVQRILGVLGELAGTGSWAHAAQDEIASQAVTRFTKLCRDIREEGRGKVIHERYAMAANKIVAEATLDRYRQEVDPELAKLVQHFPPDHDLGRRVRESAAQSLYGIAADFTWADDFVWSESLHEEALELAKGTPTAVTIESALTQVRESARTQRTYGKAKPLKEAPSLSTLNGFGVKLYGRSDYDAGSGSYSTTHYIVALFVPILPIGRYRVIDAGGGSYRFLGKLPLRKGDRWHQRIVAAGFLIWLAMNGVFSPSSYSESSSTSPYPNAYPVSTVAPGDSFPVDSNGIPTFTDLYPPDSSQSPAPPTTRKSESSILAEYDSLLIEVGRGRISALEAQLRSEVDDLEALKRRLKSLDSDLGFLKGQHDAGAPIDLDDLNSKVETYNGMLRRQRLLAAAYDADFERYDGMWQRQKTLVEQYNSRTR